MKGVGRSQVLTGRGFSTFLHGLPCKGHCQAGGTPVWPSSQQSRAVLPKCPSQ